MYAARGFWDISNPPSQVALLQLAGSLHDKQGLSCTSSPLTLGHRVKAGTNQASLPYGASRYTRLHSKQMQTRSHGQAYLSKIDQTLVRARQLRKHASAVRGVYGGIARWQLRVTKVRASESIGRIFQSCRVRRVVKDSAEERRSPPTLSEGSPTGSLRRGDGRRAGQTKQSAMWKRET